MADAQAVAEAGAFSIVVEGVVEPLAREITERVAVPTIGIGASAACDGQVLVADDSSACSTTSRRSSSSAMPRSASEIGKAVGAYAADVRARRFPGPEHIFAPGQRPQPTAPVPPRTSRPH